MKLLIADDQTSVHRFLEKMIDWPALGITDICHAYNGQEVVDCVLMSPPDLLLLDIQMPVATGLDALRQLRDLPHKPKTVILSAYDTFEYAQEAIGLSVSQYLLKPIDADQLKTIMSRLVREAREERIARLSGRLTEVLGSNRTQAADWPMIGEDLNHLGIKQVCAVTVLGGSLTDPLTGQPDQSDAAVTVVPLARLGSGGEWTALVGLPHPSRESRLTAWISECLEHMQRFSVGPVTAGLSGWTGECSGIPALIEQSRSAVRRGFYRPGEVHVFVCAPQDDQEIRRNVLETEQELGRRMKEGYPASAIRQLLGALFLQLQEQEMEPEFVYAITYRLYLIMMRYSMLPDAAADEPLSALEWKEQNRSLLDVQAALYAGLEKDSCEKKSKLPQILVQVKTFVDAHYDQDVSLQTIAERFSIDKYQLSRLYKQEFGENYWHYVTRVRMEKASELLKETDWKNGQIAERTGFLEESHFSKAFKKHFGVSPKEYRQSPP